MWVDLSAMRIVTRHRLKTCATEDGEKLRVTQVANLCYGRRKGCQPVLRGGQRGAARAREPALLSPRSQDGGAEKASSE